MTDQHDGHGPIASRDRRGRDLAERAAQHRPGAYGDLPESPRPNPDAAKEAPRLAAHLPVARTAPPVNELLADVMALCSNHVTKLKATGLTTPKDAAMLEQVAKTIKLVHDLDRQVREELVEEFGQLSDEQLAAKLKERG